MSERGGAGIGGGNSGGAGGAAELIVITGGEITATGGEGGAGIGSGADGGRTWGSADDILDADTAILDIAFPCCKRYNVHMARKAARIGKGEVQ